MELIVPPPTSAPNAQHRQHPCSVTYLQYYQHTLQSVVFLTQLDLYALAQTLVVKRDPSDNDNFTGRMAHGIYTRINVLTKALLKKDENQETLLCRLC